MTRLLVLGGGGAIGSAVARLALASGIRVDAAVRPGGDASRLPSLAGATVHDCDVRDRAALAALLRQVVPSLLVATAFSKGHPATPEARLDALDGMTRVLLALFEALRDLRFQGRLVMLGSSMAYGAGEAPRHPRDPLRPQAFRGAVKAAESVLATQLAGEFGIALAELRVFSGYGPYIQRERLVARLLQAALGGPRVALSAEPRQRDWIHFEDIARACLAAERIEEHQPRVFNICSGELASTHRVASLLEAVCGQALVADVPFAGDDRFGDVQPGVLPNPEDGLDWCPRLNLASGLAGCWQWARTPAGRRYLLGSAT